MKAKAFPFTANVTSIIFIVALLIASAIAIGAGPAISDGLLAFD